MREASARHDAATDSTTEIFRSAPPPRLASAAADGVSASAAASPPAFSPVTRSTSFAFALRWKARWYSTAGVRNHAGYLDTQWLRSFHLYRSAS